MLTGFLLVGLAVACRLLSPIYHTWNFVPIGAVALYAGSRLPRKWAWAVPVVAMLASDILLENLYYGPQPLFGLTRWAAYLTVAASTMMGLATRSRRFRGWMLPVLSIGASRLFFITTNFAVWAEGQLYPMTWQGLTTCYIAAIPFFWPAVAADLLGTCALFGLGSVVERLGMQAVQALHPAPKVKVQPIEVRENR
jgi:hypothetical protein